MKFEPASKLLDSVHIVRLKADGVDVMLNKRPLACLATKILRQQSLWRVRPTNQSHNDIKGVRLATILTRKIN